MSDYQPADQIGPFEVFLLTFGVAFGAFIVARGMGWRLPWLIGLIKDATGSYSYGLLMLAALVAAGAFLVLTIEHDIALEHAPEQPATEMV